MHVRRLTVVAVIFFLPAVTIAAAPNCSPYQCNDGTNIARCTPDGTVLNYVAAPCLTHGGEKSAQSFSDVPATHPNADAIHYVQQQGIVSGYSDGTFRPDQTINRAEFSKIVTALTANLSTEGTRLAHETCEQIIAGNFTDVQDTAWYAPFLCRNVQFGVVAGYPDRTFRPSQNVNFVEAAKMIGVAIDPYDFTLPPPTSGGEWYERFVHYLGMQKAIPLSIMHFDHQLTRGEMAEIIYRLKTKTTDKPSQTYESLQGMNEQTQVTTYTNTQYSYSIQYPKGWFIDTTSAEKAFSQRGGGDTIGGDLSITNYQKPADAGLLEPDPAFAVHLFLLIYRVDADSSVQDFINSKAFSPHTSSPVTINGVQGVRLQFSPGESPYDTTHILLKVGENLFNWSYSHLPDNNPPGLSQGEQIIQSFHSL